MTDEERFAEILEELNVLLVQLGDLRSHAIVIGGQVIALHALSMGRSAAIQTTTSTGVQVTRGFTHEPDLLFDFDESTFGTERLVEVLRERGFGRSSRPWSWGKKLPSGGEMFVDLFRPELLSEEAAPTAMTPLRNADVVARRPSSLTVSLGGREVVWRVPDAFAFMRLKVTAKLVHRPESSKDCFDLYVFLRVLGVESVRESFAQAPAGERAQLTGELRELSWSATSRGVRDVVKEVIGLSSDEQSLLEREVVDLFEELLS